MSRSRASGDEQVITKEMIGLFIVFGGDVILLVVLLAAVDVLSWTAALGISGIILTFFGSWAAYRWRRIRVPEPSTDADQESSDDTPLETLKSRYAAGELSDEEFEAKLDQLMDSERQRETNLEHRDTDTSSTVTDERTLEK